MPVLRYIEALVNCLHCSIVSGAARLAYQVWAAAGVGEGAGATTAGVPDGGGRHAEGETPGRRHRAGAAPGKHRRLGKHGLRKGGKAQQGEVSKAEQGEESKA